MGNVVVKNQQSKYNQINRNNNQFGESLQEKCSNYSKRMKKYNNTGDFIQIYILINPYSYTIIGLYQNKFIVQLF